jgi:pyruvate-formate lyase-activating enzyme
MQSKLSKLVFNHININFTLTESCNFKCSYCIQGFNQDSPIVLNINYFELILKKLKKEIIKNKITSLDITLMGGELSTQINFLNYFELINKVFENSSIEVHVNFLTNFSGNFNFFEKLNNMFNKISITFDISIHPEYFTKINLSKIIKFINIIDNKNDIIINYLYSNYIFIPDFELELDKLKLLNKKIIINKTLIRKAGYIDKKRTIGRYCNALYYLVFPDGKIIDQCRQKEFNFINFKVIPKIIECYRECPCPFLEKEFVQINKNQIINN